MNWLFPSFLGAAAGALLPLLLHLLRKRRRQATPFPSLQFFALASKQDRRRHRLRRWIVLLLRCTIFGLLAAAFARPFFPDSRSDKTRATVIVLDNSFSMQAAGRWPALQSWALGLLKKTSPGESVGLLLMNPKPTWLAAPTRNVDSVAAALTRFTPGWEGTHVLPALRFAGDTLAAGSAEERRIIVVSDQQACGWINADLGKTLPPGVQLVFPPPAEPLRAQAALAAAAVSREGDKVTVRVPVKAYAGRADRTIKLFAGSQTTPLAERTLRVEEGSTQSVVLSGAFPSTETWVRCELERDDLPGDDTVYALVASPEQAQSVWLDAMPPEAVTDYLATACEELAKIPPGWRVLMAGAGEWPKGAVLILRNDASFGGSPGQRLEQFLEAGGAAVMFATGGELQSEWLSKRGLSIQALPGKARLRDWAVEHPMVAPLAERSLRNLIGWRFLRAWSLPSEAVEPLAFWDDGFAAVGELGVGNGRVVLVGFFADRRGGNWPLEGAFLPFVDRAARYLLDARVHAPEPVVQLGGVLSLPEGEGKWTALAGPESGKPARDVQGGIIPTAPGIYEWTAPHQAPRRYVVGLSPEESDPAPVQGTPWARLVSAEPLPKAAQTRNVLLAAEEAEHQQKWWWWALAAVVFLLTVELGLANRTAR